MKKTIILLFAIMLSVTALHAQNPDNDANNMTRWLNEMREYKHTFLTQQLELTREQQARFFAVYDKMEDEINKINSDTRAMQRRIASTDDNSVTDLEYDMAIQAQFEQKKKEAEIEERYLPELKEILTKKQLFNLKEAERRFSMRMMRRHHELRDKNPR